MNVFSLITLNTHWNVNREYITSTLLVLSKQTINAIILIALFRKLVIKIPFLFGSLTDVFVGRLSFIK